MCLRPNHVLTLMLVGSTMCLGQDHPSTIHFFDEFDGESPLTWILGESIPFGAEFDFQVGPNDLTISGTGAVPIIPTVDARPLVGADFTLTMQAEAQPDVYLAFYSRIDRTGTNVYFGGTDQRGRAVLQEWEDSDIVELHRLFQDFDVYENDVFIEFETIGDQLDVRLWPLDEERPEIADVSLKDASNPSGGFGIAFLGSSEVPENNMATIRSVDVVYHRSGDFGDVNHDNVLDDADIAKIVENFHVDFIDLQFDVSGDLRINADDVFTWIKDAKLTYIGDANLDGEFSSSDFVQVFGAAEYEDGIVANSTWTTGDWNSDGDFDSGDFVVAFQDGGYEQGRRVATHAVPEPAANSLILFSVCVCLCLGSRGYERYRVTQ